jgi:serine/threonine-protein kinase
MSSDGSKSDPEATATRRVGTLLRRDSGSEPTTTSTHPGARPKRRVDPDVGGLGEAGSGRRYRLRKVIGRGGMGEVHLARDERIGRSVALKAMREEDATHAEARSRFLREARVQAQLEHPAIVPVYDLDTDAEGRVFFSMKRIGGVTMEDVIRELRSGAPAARQKHSVRKLLSALQQVCLAVDYAHARGVIHRDLKPSNLMLGDFGEVYVLDWGIAKVLGTADPDPERAVFDPERGHDSTRHGDVLGTIGYMAPEQMLDSSTVDARSDVYALGAVLFQLLTLEPLHGTGTLPERARSTQAGADARASVRAPHLEIPPELDAVCVKATAIDPSERYAGARELHDAIDRFLEGDRDLRLRAELAERHVAAAREAAGQVFEGGADAPRQRRIALREAGRAVALDPENEAAAEVLARLMLEPPKELPREVVEETDALVEHEAHRGGLLGAFALLGFAAVTTILVPAGLRSPLGLLLIVLPLLVAAAHGFYIATARSKRFRTHAVLLAIPVCVSIGAVSGIAGALVVAPVYALAFAVVATTIQGLGRHRLIMVGLALLSLIVPSLAEWAGLLPPAYRFEGGAITILPQVIELEETKLRLGLLFTNLVTIVFVCALLWRFGDAGAKSRQQLQLHAWHLRQLAPAKRDAAAKDEERAADDTRRTHRG